MEHSGRGIAGVPTDIVGEGRSGSWQGVKGNVAEDQWEP